ncbi:hypothetical protein C8R43DRAFT_297823 [Mycena crocata]|nr:hypothetical protein C8R43DRAFT_297823 [Mycena crocata]
MTDSSLHREEVSSRVIAGSPSHLRTRLVAIDEEIHALELRLQLLSAERREVVQDLDSLVYPVLTLPPEITSEIFSHYVDHPRLGRPRIGRPRARIQRLILSDEPQGISDSWHGPWLLAEVCRSWRDICLTTPALWATLRIYPEDHSSDNMLRLLQCWLPRAAAQSLDIRVYESIFNTSEIFSFLARYSTQWQILDIALLPSLDFPNDTIIGRLPNLTKLSVKSPGFRNVAPVKALTAFAKAPLLRSVTLIDVVLSRISLPWMQLTHLNLSFDSVARCVEVLKQTPNLQILSVSLRLPSVRAPVSEILVLRHLDTLNVRESDGWLFDHLTLPALRALELSHLRGEGVPRLVDLTRRSTWPLTSLRLTNVIFESSLGCLHYLPSLERVDIIHDILGFEYNLAMLSHFLTHNVAFLPALLRLSIWTNTATMPADAVEDMLASRWHKKQDGVARLHFFRLKCPVDAQVVEELATRLRPLIEEGLEVVLISSQG